MIAVSRGSEPSSLKENAENWTEELLDLKRQIEFAPTESKRKELERSYKKLQLKYKQDDVREKLRKMFDGKCAYCESRIEVVSYPDIEHFYPKSKYPEKTFLWSNLLYACNKCNRTYKRDKFPVNVDGKPLLIDPSESDLKVSQHLDFIWDREVKISLIKGLDKRGETFVETFELNDRKELMRERNERMIQCLALLQFAKQGNSEAERLLRELMLIPQPYLAFLRKYVFSQLPP